MMQKALYGYFVILAWPSQLIAESNNDLSSLSLEELLNIKVQVSNRGSGRSFIESPVPIEVVSEDELLATGQFSLPDALVRASSSFHYLHFALRDGSDHALPFSLRGFNPNQTLVLINGKRLHAQSIVHLSSALGRGTSSVDLSTIPISAVEQVEILKDGDSAQYGSDAIAGIINIKLKKGSENKLSVYAGETSQGDGERQYFSFSSGKHWSEHQYIQGSLEYFDQRQTNRAGPDTRQQYFTGDPNNNDPRYINPINMVDGDIEREDKKLAISGSVELAEEFRLYGWFNGNERESGSKLFFRRPLDNRTVRSIYPDGFLPELRPEIWDTSLTIGVNHYGGSNWDLAFTRGRNSFHYFVDNSVNASLGQNSSTAFDSGRLGFSHKVVNFDWFKNIGHWQMALGAEYRDEQFEVKAGEYASYSHGGVAVLDGPNQGAITQSGAQGFPGFRPENAVDVSRDNGCVC